MGIPDIAPVFDGELRLIAKVLQKRGVKLRSIEQRLIECRVLNQVDQDVLGPANFFHHW